MPYERLQYISTHCFWISLLPRLKRKSVRMKRGIRLVHHTGSNIASTLTLQVTSLRVTMTGNQDKQQARKHSPRSWPRGSSLINDNHCVFSVTGQKNSVNVTSQGDLDPAPVVTENSKVTLKLNVDSHVANAHIVTGLPQRKGVNPTFYCEKYTYHFLTIAICCCHPTHWPTLRNVLRYLKRPVSECELACPPSGHVTTLVNNLHYFCWPS